MNYKMGEFVEFNETKSKIDNIKDSKRYDFYIDDGENRYFLDSTRCSIGEDHLIIEGRPVLENLDQIILKQRFEDERRINIPELKRKINQVNFYTNTSIVRGDTIIQLKLDASNLERTTIHKRRRWRPVVITVGVVGGVGVLIYVISENAFSGVASGGLSVVK